MQITEDQYIGLRLKMRRKIIGMSQAELGNYEGLTFQQVQKYEKGMNRIGSGRLYRFSKVLKVPVTYFYEGIEGATRKEDSEGRRDNNDSDSDSNSNGNSDNNNNKTKYSIINEKKEKDLEKLSGYFINIEDENVRKSVIELVKNLRN